MNRKSLYAILLPVAAFLILGLGILIGSQSNTVHFGFGNDKLSRALQIVREQYVDTVDADKLTDMALSSLFQSLDPHSEYIPKSELQAVNDDLAGSFSGIGISFQIVADTVTVVEAIVGGPAEKVGIIAGDRIISANGKSLAGSGVSNDDVFSILRGPKGTKVKLEVKRPNSHKTAIYEIVRNDIPVNSVDAFYLMNDRKTGYIKLSKFTKNTYLEFIKALNSLKKEGARQYILDLRGNPGGYMDQAIMIANEFLPEGRKIVYTKARTEENRMEAVSDGAGSYKTVPLAVILNEYSASASEIIAGAIQDNDRGVVVGRRSFGKGLVQTQIDLPDSSALRLTVARYYTPAGRSIQKEYKVGEAINYDMDILNRYNKGEFFHMDSIKLDKSKTFKTLRGRSVYGGGGIMPDIFVPEDTTCVTSYYISVNNAGLIQQYAFSIADEYRPLMKGVKAADHALTILPSDENLLAGFADFAESKGVPARWYYINISSPIILGQLKAFIVRDLLGYNQFYKIFNLTDRTIEVALDVLNSGYMPEKPESR